MFFFYIRPQFVSASHLSISKIHMIACISQHVTPPAWFTNENIQHRLQATGL